jgi:hypothetical protein
MTHATIASETRSITLAVADVPDMAVPYTKMTIAPAQVTITYRWTQQDGLYFTSAEVSGPRRLKSGRLSEAWVENKYLSLNDRPGWVVDLVDAHAPQDWAK